MMEMFSIFSFSKCSTLVRSGRTKKEISKESESNFAIASMEPPVFIHYFFTLSKTLLTLSFPFFSFIYLGFGVLLPSSKNFHYTL